MAKCKTESEQRECPAEAFLNMAQQYHLATTTLFPLRGRSRLSTSYTRTRSSLRSKPISDRTAAECPTRTSSPLLLQQCADQGLRVRFDLKNVIHILESENKVHGFRYFAFATTGKPEITYLREVVDDLMAVVVEEMKNRPGADLPKKVVLKMIVGRPVKK